MFFKHWNMNKDIVEEVDTNEPEIKLTLKERFIFWKDNKIEFMKDNKILTVLFFLYGLPLILICLFMVLLFLYCIGYLLIDKFYTIIFFAWDYLFKLCLIKK